MRNLRITAVALSALAAFGVSAMIAPGAHAAETLDQNTLPSGLAQGWVNSTSERGQVFTAGVTGLLSRLDIPLSKSVTATNLTVVIQGVTSGLPNGTTIASSSVNVASIPTDPTSSTVSVNFSSPASLVAGTQYAFLLQSTDAANAIIAFQGTAYAGGDKIYNGFAFSGALAFATYVTTADSGATPPPVMQQFGMPSSGTCDAAAPVMLNWGGAGSGGWGSSWAQWANGGKGGAVCTRTLVYSNAVGHWIVG
jgi:hypothetical protein